MEDIIRSLEPAFHRVERFILWHNRYASFAAFLIGNVIFYAIARAGLRPFCGIMLVILAFHILDCFKRKRVHLLNSDDQQFCELTQLILRSYRYVCQTHERLNTLKTENRVKYSLLISLICLILAIVGMKINGYYISYLIMLTLFTLPAIVYHKLIPKFLKRIAPVLDQLDRSMDYQRRSIIDRKELLVPLTRTGFTIDDDDDEDVQRLLKQHKQLPAEENPLTVSDDDAGDETDEEKLMSTDDKSQTILNFFQRYENDARVPKTTTNSMGDSSFDMLSDSSSSIADEETSRLNELYGNMASEQIDGRQRIKLRGDDLKIKGRSKQRPKLMDAQFFQPNDETTDQQIDSIKPSAPVLVNTANNPNPTDVPDIDSFDFLNEYDGSN